MSKDIDALMAALIDKLPAAGSEWSQSRRALWLRCMAHSMCLVYGGDHDPDSLLIQAVELTRELKVVRTIPVGRGQVTYGSEMVRVVIIRDECWGHSAYVAQGLERDIAAQGRSPGEAMRRLQAEAEADNAVREESGIDVPAAPPHVHAWYAQAPADEP